VKSLKDFLTRWQNRIAITIILVFFLVALLAPLLAPGDSRILPDGFKFSDDPMGFLPHPPGEAGVLGSVPTQAANRQVDVFYTTVWGTRDALRFGLTVALITTAFGVIYGAFSAYIGGSINNLMMRITDAFLAFPIIAGVVFIQQLYLLSVEASGGYVFQGHISDPGSNPIFLRTLLENVDPVMVAIILFSWMFAARLTNTRVMAVKQTDYIEASRALGAGHSRIVFRHLIPNSLTPAIILVTRDIGGVVLLQTALTFIGLGGNSPWGELLVLGRRWIFGPGGNILTYWWTYLPVTLAIVFFGIGWSLLGDGLNDWLNPRSAKNSRMG
jgi:peptide/nickel transport system permease protein